MTAAAVVTFCAIVAYLVLVAAVSSRDEENLR